MYRIKKLCWINEKEGRLGVDITDITFKKVNNDQSLYQPTSSANCSARKPEDWCIVAPLITKKDSGQNRWALPKRYLTLKSLGYGDLVEVWSDGDKILLNKLSEEKIKEIDKENEENAKKVEKALKESTHPSKKIGYNTSWGGQENKDRLMCMTEDKEK